MNKEKLSPLLGLRHLRPDDGTLSLAGRPLRGKPHQVASAGLTRTYQAVRIYKPLTARENIEAALLDARHRPDRGEISEMIAFLDLEPQLDKIAGGLTLYEQRRLELLMRLVQKPDLVMLDEPVGGLASAEVRKMIDLLTQLKGRTSIFVIEHTMKVIREIADRVVVLLAGEKIVDGAPGEVLRDKLSSI
jgi:ABC-type branched-subunit amino acid transport system ATPase component